MGEPFIFYIFYLWLLMLIFNFFGFVIIYYRLKELLEEEQETENE